MSRPTLEKSAEAIGRIYASIWSYHWMCFRKQIIWNEPSSNHEYDSRCRNGISLHQNRIKVTRNTPKKKIFNNLPKVLVQFQEYVSQVDFYCLFLSSIHPGVFRYTMPSYDMSVEMAFWMLSGVSKTLWCYRDLS